MIAIPNSDKIPPETYLKLEANSPVKHEYRQGDVYARAGASKIHVLIAGNLCVLLRNRLRGSECLPYISDTKVRLERANAYYYPDVAVSCGSRVPLRGSLRDRNSTDSLCYPCLIAEVLSASTEAFDRGDKFADYRSLESLQEYLLISQTRRRVDVFRRNTEGQWVLSAYGEGDTVHLASLDCDFAIADLYEDVEFTANS